MRDRLDELLQGSLSGPIPLEDCPRHNLGAQVRSRAARQDRLRRNTMIAASAMVLFAGVATLANYARQNSGADSEQVNQLAHLERHVTEADQGAEEAGPTDLTEAQIAAMVDELDATAQFVRETVEQIRMDEQTRQLRRELSRYETQNVMDPAIDQTVAIGLADARRLASTQPDEAGQRLSRLVELFPNSALAADAKNQLHQLQNREVMP
jgi:hypothetical protein